MLEDEICRDKLDGIRAEAQNIIINDIYDLWCSLKREMKDSTFQNYKLLPRILDGCGCNPCENPMSSAFITRWQTSGT